MTYWDVEYTDTFAGEANYCWVKRATISVPEDAKRSTIMRRAKAAMGLSGLRGESVNYGDTIEFRPYRMCCTVLFATRHDCGAHAHCDHGEDQ